MTYQPYPWHTVQWQQLIARWQQQRLPHGILLTGPEGLGQGHFALAWTAFLLCEDTQKTEHACGHCQSCRWLQSQSHPAVRWVQPEKSGAAIKVDQIRDMLGFEQTSNALAYQIILIEPADAMNMAAANALLKALEEPRNAKTLFLLVSEQPASLLATIRSRCQLLPLSLTDRVQGRAWLQQQSQHPDNELALALCDDAPVKALSLLQSGEWPLRAELLQGCQNLLQGKTDVVSVVEKLTNQADIHTIIFYLQTLIMDCIRHQLGQAIHHHIDQQRLITHLCEQLTSARCYHLLDLLTHTTKQIRLGFNPNKNLLLEKLLVSVVG